MNRGMRRGRKSANITQWVVSAAILVSVFVAPMRLWAQTPSDLTGTYISDDGGIYYMQQSGNVLWWAGMSRDAVLPAVQQLHHGLTFTNVFRGIIAGDGSISGEWIELSRGATLNTGTLTLAVALTDTGWVLAKSAATGKLSATVWEPNGVVDDTTDIFSVFDTVYKNDGSGTIHDNLKPYRDATVFYARVTADAMVFDLSLVHQPPHVNFGTPFPPPIGPIDGFLNFGFQDRSFQSFASSSDEGDGDFDFKLVIDQSKLEPDFWNTGWGDLDPTPILDKLNQPYVHSRLGYGVNDAYMGAEGIMWGQPSVSGLLPLPAWSQVGSDSILVNGRPLNGALQLETPTPTCNFPQPCPYVVPGDRLADGIQIGDLSIVVGNYVRVTGTLVLDCGHSDLDLDLSHLFGPCYDETDDSANFLYQNQEIHPLNSIDIINYPFRPEDSMVAARENLTGTWGGSDGSTYYVRQIGNTIWWLGLPRDRQPMQRGTNPQAWLYPPIASLQLAAALRAGTAPVDFNANCGPGTAIYGVLLGAAYPCWAFANVFNGTISQQSDGTSTIQGDWGGVPQSASPGNAGSSQAFTVDAKRKLIQPVASLATIFPTTLQKLYEPEDTTPPNSTLTVGAPQYAGGSGQPFVASATLFTVSGTDQDSGMQNIWYRDFAQGTTPPSYTPVVSSMASFTLSGTDGVYEVDSYATDNAGNDESAHTQLVYLDNTPPQITISQPAATQYPHSATLTLNYSVSDGPGSGVQSSVPKMDGGTTLPDGTGLSSGQSISLLTELSLGTHTFSVNAVDNVNNAGSQSVTFSIIVTPDSIKGDVQQFLQAGAIKNNGQANSLLAKLDSAGAARTRGDCSTAANIYRAFINELQAQSGKGVTAAAAAVMIADAQYLVSNCP